MRVLSSALATAEIVALRAFLPRWFARQPLDALLERLSASPLPGARSDLRRLVRDVARAEALVERVTALPRTCLYRALARYAVLCAAGHSPTFFMGLPRSGEDSAGHAWVEVGGAAFAELEDVSRFKVTFRYPPPPNGGTLAEP
jgi:hypothetical protein